MEPIEESVRAAAEFDPDIDETVLWDELRTRSEQVRAVVPECLGMSVAMRSLGVTLTLVSSSQQTAILDAMQYLNSGPCLEAADCAEVLSFTAEELLSEATWQLFAQRATSYGVASTLTLPVVVDGEVRGTVNLYATAEHAFDGHHQELADILGASATGATTNADLSFTTIDIARQAPRILADRALLETAAGIVMATAHVSDDEAVQRLRDAARRAGVSELQVAEAVVAAIHDQETWPGT
jgi:GAF domain-containing protein